MKPQEERTAEAIIWFIIALICPQAAIEEMECHRYRERLGVKDGKDS